MTLWQYLGSITQSIYELIKKTKKSRKKSFDTIRSYICTCHNKSIALACKKFWPVLIIIFHGRASILLQDLYHRLINSLWNVSHATVKWFHYSHAIDRVMHLFSPASQLFHQLIAFSLNQVYLSTILGCFHSWTKWMLIITFNYSLLFIKVLYLSFTLM